MIVRHGTRYPGSKVIRKMKERLPMLRDSVIQNHKLKRGNDCFRPRERITFNIFLLVWCMVFNGTLFVIKQYSHCMFFQLLGLISFWILVLIIMQGSAGMT
jgi:hypothetical protein